MTEGAGPSLQPATDPLVTLRRHSYRTVGQPVVQPPAEARISRTNVVCSGNQRETVPCAQRSSSLPAASPLEFAIDRDTVWAEGCCCRKRRTLPRLTATSRGLIEVLLEDLARRPTSDQPPASRSQCLSCRSIWDITTQCQFPITSLVLWLW